MFTKWMKSRKAQGPTEAMVSTYRFRACHWDGRCQDEDGCSDGCSVYPQKES